MRHPRFAHVHASGRFTASPAQTCAAWDGFRSKVGVRLITGTEHGSGDNDRAFKADGWDHVRLGELVASWRADTFELAWEPSLDHVGTRFYRGGNRNARTPLLSVPLRHLVTGRVVMVRVSHTPAHVQDGDSFRRTTARVIAQTVAWASSLRAVGRRTRRFGRNHPGGAQIMAADWNVDVHSAHWRNLIGTTLGLRCADARTLPKSGDMGRRLISWFYVGGLTVADTGILPKTPGFDHHPVVALFVVKPRSRPGVK